MVFDSEKKALSDGLLQIPWKKLLRKFKIDKFKITSSRENHAHFISCKPPHKNHPREYFGTTLCFIQLQHQLLRNLKFYQLHFIWPPLYNINQDHPISSCCEEVLYCTISTECSQGVTHDLWCSLAQVFTGVCDVWQPWKCSENFEVFISCGGFPDGWQGKFCEVGSGEDLLATIEG